MADLSGPDWEPITEQEFAAWAQQSMTACCPRQTIPDSCSCLEGCTCTCTDCICGNWGEEYEDE